MHLKRRESYDGTRRSLVLHVGYISDDLEARGSLREADT